MAINDLQAEREALARNHKKVADELNAIDDALATIDRKIQDTASGYIITLGYLTGGFTFVGPFATQLDAEQYADDAAFSEWTTAELYAPEEAEPDAA
jgi:hypoxanthine-guanine phosphoribosyltransferase